VKFTHDMTYDASPEQVHAMLADPAFREQVCEAMHAIRHEVSIDPDGDNMTVMVDQTQPAKGIPSFAKKFVGDQIQIVQREAWNGQHAAGLEVEIPGKPGHMKGGIALKGDGSTTTETVAGEIKVSIPMLGGKLESLIADLLRSALRTEEKVARKYLAG
jgi:uncharacterized protein YndB with AHSA1/START domain